MRLKRSRMGILKYIRRIAIFIFILNCQPFRAILKKKINNKIVPNTVMRKNNLWNKVFSWLTPYWIKCLLCMEHFELLFNLYRSVSIYQRLILLLFFLRNLYMLWMTKTVISLHLWYYQKCELLVLSRFICTNPF